MGTFPIIISIAPSTANLIW